MASMKTVIDYALKKCPTSKKAQLDAEIVAAYGLEEVSGPVDKLLNILEMLEPVYLAADTSQVIAQA